ncbi:MAG: diguanylate cyclase [Anaerolineales bacterium]
MAKRKISKPASSSTQADVKRLSAQLARLQKKYAKAVLEKNFLERSLGDLNFHNNAHDGIVYTDAHNRITYANPYFLKMMGVKKKSELIDQTFPNYMWSNPDEAARLFKDIQENGFVRERELSLYNRTGQPVFAMCSGVSSKDEQGNIMGAEFMFCNVTGKRTFQSELVEQYALLDAMLESTPDPVLVLTPMLEVSRSNPAAQTLFDLGKVEIRPPLLAILAMVKFSSDTIQRMEAGFATEQSFEIEVTLHGEFFELHAAPLKSQQKGWVCVLHNVTVRKHTQEMLQRHAFHDVLTQLPNRAYFRDVLQRSNLRVKTEPDYRFAVLFIDLDNLKNVNDQWGHHIGDQLLIDFSRRLESSIRPGDLVSRLGGDEFGILLDGVSNEGSALQVAARIRESLVQPYTFNQGDSLVATASIGIALSSKFNEDVDTLLRNADQAMYGVKKRGGNSYEVFGDEVFGQVAGQQSA